MGLLILTQKIDRDDAILGFFHEWVARFASEFDRVTVICLAKGNYDLPSNVRVYSLGKEEGLSRVRYIRRFYSHIFKFRNDYDAVFVHMNPEYVLLGSFLWHWWGKPVGLWYNHTYGSWRARLAFRLADKIYHTSPYAFSTGYAKSERMPAGIDTEHFKPMREIDRVSSSILYVGRIAPVKHVDLLFDAFELLKREGMATTLTVVGSAARSDEAYLANLEERAARYGRDVSFFGSIANRDMPPVYNAAEVTVNLTPRGNYDKTVLESMACETIVVLSSEAFADAVPSEFRFAEGDAKNLADRLVRVLKMSETGKVPHKIAARRYVVEHHDLGLLSRRLKDSIESLPKR